MSSDLRALVTDVLTEDGWPWREDEEYDRYEFAVSSDSGHWDVRVYVLDDERQVLVFSVLPVSVPDDRRAAMYDLLNRANFGLVAGSFELDPDGGGVRFRTSLLADGAVLSGSLIRHVVHANVAVVDRYLPAVMRLIYSDASPRDAVAAVEQA